MIKPVKSSSEWNNYDPSDETLEVCVKEFLKILDTSETSDSGNDFRPTYISSCRVYDTFRLEKLIHRMKELVK